MVGKLNREANDDFAFAERNISCTDWPVVSIIRAALICFCARKVINFTIAVGQAKACQCYFILQDSDLYKLSILSNIVHLLNLKYVSVLLRFGPICKCKLKATNRIACHVGYSGQPKLVQRSFKHAIVNFAHIRPSFHSLIRHTCICPTNLGLAQKGALWKRFNRQETARANLLPQTRQFAFYFGHANLMQCLLTVHVPL